MFRSLLFVLISSGTCLFASNALGQVQLLAPIKRALDLDKQFFPYVDVLRSECTKTPEKEFCGRVESFDAVEALRAEHCSTDGKDDSRCKEWLVLEECKADSRDSKKSHKDKQRGAKHAGQSCTKILAAHKLQEARFALNCLKKLDEPYCEGIAFQKAKKKEKRQAKKEERRKKWREKLEDKKDHHRKDDKKDHKHH